MIIIIEIDLAESILSCIFQSLLVHLGSIIFCWLLLVDSQSFIVYDKVISYYYCFMINFIVYDTVTVYDKLLSTLTTLFDTKFEHE